MKTALIQSPLTWENPAANRAYFEEKIVSITEPVDLIVLPEMFTTGFTMHPQPLAEPMDGATITWMKALAQTNNLAITGSLIIQENGNFYNRLVFVFPSGEIKTYDKRHLFTLAGEEKTYTPGKERLIVEYKNFRICLLVCYDLRFPVFSRNTEEYDALIYVANWPNVRVNAWDALLKARAIENLSYVIGVNRVGEDGNQHSYSGHSQVIDYLGNYVLEPQGAAAIFIVNLEKEVLLETRKKFGFLNDRDAFTVD